MATRDRVFINQVDNQTYPHVWYLNNSGYVYNDETTYPYRTQFDTMRDEVVPNFHKRVAAGEVFFNPMCRVYRKRLEICCGYSYVFKPSYGGGGFGSGSKLISANSNLSLPATQSLNTLEETYFLYDDPSVAVAKAWANVDVSEAQAMASIGEMPETVYWIVSLLTRAIKITRFFKSQRYRMKVLNKMSSDGMSTVDSLSNLWLEYRYAMRPLVFEMTQAITALGASVAKGTRQTARGYDEDFTTSSGTWTIDNGLTAVTTGSYYKATRLSFRAGVLYDIEQDINGILALWGFDQPWETIWELTPFSFIVDWFFNIGDIISGWSEQASLRALGSWVTIREDTVTTAKALSFEINTHPLLASGSIMAQQGILTDQTIYTQRVPSPSRPIIPTLNLKLDVSKLIDLATIGRGLYRGLVA